MKARTCVLSQYFLYAHIQERESISDTQVPGTNTSSRLRPQVERDNEPRAAEGKLIPQTIIKYDPTPVFDIEVVRSGTKVLENLESDLFPFKTGLRTWAVTSYNCKRRQTIIVVVPVITLPPSRR